MNSVGKEQSITALPSCVPPASVGSRVPGSLPSLAGDTEQLRSHIVLHEAARSDTTREARASNRAPGLATLGLLLQDLLPRWVLSTDTPRGTAGPWGPSLPAGPQRWHRVGQSNSLPLRAQLRPALPGPYLLSSSFPPLVQGAAEVGAGVAASLVPTLLWSPGSPSWAALEGQAFIKHWNRLPGEVVQSPSLGGIQKTCRHGTWGHGLVGTGVLG